MHLLLCTCFDYAVCVEAVDVLDALIGEWALQVGVRLIRVLNVHKVLVACIESSYRAERVN